MALGWFSHPQGPNNKKNDVGLVGHPIFALRVSGHPIVFKDGSATPNGQIKYIYI
jgi:hypothetical protein